jgi:hypothetical protein
MRGPNCQHVDETERPAAGLRKPYEVDHVRSMLGFDWALICGFGQHQHSLVSF